MINKEIITHSFEDLQEAICTELNILDGVSAFKKDTWYRREGGGGVSAIIESGNLIEKGGVNFSAVWGPTPGHIREQFQYEGDRFYATGVSIVLHPSNPYVPIIHMNIRYFELDEHIWWFGGGIDLTPHYIDLQEAGLFHARLKAVCDQHQAANYQKFKTWADDYFFIKHRAETRGVGGIFFDRLSQPGEKEVIFDFVRNLGQSFVPLYKEIANRKRSMPFSERERQWQFLRRGRYVEFNLVLDRGTKFGLETNGRTESILMSLPPMATWKYDYQPQKDSPEWHTLQSLKKNIDWAHA
jgi:coproporphyrinogen III oxidase